MNDDCDTDDCMNCGYCESCIDRSIAAAEEHEPTTCSMCPAFIWAAESVRTGKCHGCRSPGPQFVVETPPAAAPGEGG